MRWRILVLGVRLDGLSAIFALLALVVGAVVFLYSAAYLPARGSGATNFYTLMTAFMASVLLLVLADDVVFAVHRLGVGVAGVVYAYCPVWWAWR